MKKSKRIQYILALTMIAVLSVAGAAFAQDETPMTPDAPPPTIASDWADYTPGSPVTLTGANWQGDTEVRIFVNDDVWQSWSRDVIVPVADDGSITDGFNLPDSFIATYSVAATGQQTGRVATTTFTDGNVKAFPRPGYTTFSVTVTVYGTTDCTDSPTSGPSTTTGVDTTSGKTTGAGNAESIKLTAAMTSDQGGAFLHWASSAAFTVLNPSTGGNEVCVPGFSGGGAHDYYAHYGAVTVTKTANTAFTRTYNWSITKTASPAAWDLFTGDTGTSGYTISVPAPGYTDSDFKVSGNITVKNVLSEAVTINSVSDLVAPGYPAVVTCLTAPPFGLEANNGAPGGADEVTCTYVAGPYATNVFGDTGTNTATVSVTTPADPPHFEEVTDDVVGTADYDFADAVITEVHPSVTVSDTNGEDPWQLSVSGTTFPWSETYDQSFTCDGDAGTHSNTASITYDDDVDTDGPTSIAEVTVTCYALGVTKTASTALTRTWSWTISKSADPTSLTLAIGEPSSVNYTVGVNATSADSGWAASGDITIHNPAPVDAVINSVSDLVSPDIVATVTCGVTFPKTLAKDDGAAGGLDELTCTYSADLPNANARTNTATATLQNYNYDKDGVGTKAGTTNFSGSASVVFTGVTVGQVDECATVTDVSQLGTVCAPAGIPATFKYARAIGPYSTAGPRTVTNTASFVTNDTGATGSASATVSVTVLGQQWFSQVTDSSQCMFDKDPGTAGRQFNLIYTQDPTSPSTYKLTASNPGQFYYNIFYYNGGASPVNLVVNIPAPFVTQGATPVHWYDGVTKVGDCYINGNPLASSNQTISGYAGGTITVNVPAGATYFITIHLDYGLKGTRGWAKGDGTVGKSVLTTAYNSTYGNLATNKQYSFGVTGLTPVADVYSINVFKKNPGVAGEAVSASTSNPKANAKVQIYDANKKLLGTVYTDSDGFYQWIYKYTGKAATFTVKLPDYGKSQSVTLKSNGFLEVNFTDLP